MGRKVFIVGCGAVGTSLGKALLHAGREIVGIFDTNAKQAGESALILGVQGFGGALPEIIKTADTVVVTVPDESIEKVASLAQAEGLYSENQVWIHCSGQLTASALDPISNSVLGTGTMHPAFVFPPHQCTPIPEGVFFAVGGNKSALEVILRHVALLKGKAVEISPDKRPAYHAAMVMASNYVATLMACSKSILSDCGVHSEDAEPLLLNLASSAISRAQNMGVGSSLSGPIRRGDVGAVEAHLKALDANKDVKKLYIAAGRGTVALAAAQPGYCPDTAETLLSLFDRESEGC